MAEATELILDPNGNRHRDGRRWIAIQRTCLRSLAPATVTIVDGPEEAAQAAKDSALKGYLKIISVGDSRTGHGVVNGLMTLAESHRKRLKVGFLSFLQPDPWSRTLGLPRGLERQLEILQAGHTLPYDVGRVDCESMDGALVTRHFLNGARFGITGAVRREWRDPETNLLQAIARIARLAGIAPERGGGATHGSHVRLEGDDGVLYEGRCALGMLMEGCYDPLFGRIAPQADPTDGLLELAWLGDRTGWSALLGLAALVLGGLGAPRAPLNWSRVERVRAVPLDGLMPVEADGEPVGKLPATFSVDRRALPVIVAPVAIQFRKPQFASVSKLPGGRLAGNVKSAAGQ